MRPPPKSDNGKYCRSSKSQDRIGIITGGRGGDQPQRSRSPLPWDVQGVTPLYLKEYRDATSTTASGDKCGEKRLVTDG